MLCKIIFIHSHLLNFLYVFPKGNLISTNPFPDGIANVNVE